MHSFASRAAVFVAAAALLVAFAPVAAAAEEATLAVLRLRPEVYVAGPDIYLAEVADIKSSDAALKERLGAVAVGRAPLPGQERTLHVATVETRLRQQRLPVRQIEIVADGPEIIVRTRSVTVSGEALAGAALNALSLEGVPLPGGLPEDADVRLACTAPAPVTVGADEATLRLQRMSGTAPGALIAMMEIVAGGSPVRTVAVRCDALLELNVLIAGGPLQRHDVLQWDMLETERRTFSSLPRDGLVPTEHPERWRMTRPVAAGTVLTMGMVEPVPVVGRGERVNIVATLGGIVAAAPGVALDDGKVGDVIRVQNSLSGQVVEARVVDEETVSAVVR